jgi:hypothetical protein
MRRILAASVTSQQQTPPAARSAHSRAWSADKDRRSRWPSGRSGKALWSPGNRYARRPLCGAGPWRCLGQIAFPMSQQRRRHDSQSSVVGPHAPRSAAQAAMPRRAFGAPAGCRFPASDYNAASKIRFRPAPSSSGLGHRPFTAVTRVQIPSGSLSAFPAISKGFPASDKPAESGTFRGSGCSALEALEAAREANRAADSRR